MKYEQALEVYFNDDKDKPQPSAKLSVELDNGDWLLKNTNGLLAAIHDGRRFVRSERRPEKSELELMGIVNSLPEGVICFETERYRVRLAKPSSASSFPKYELMNRLFAH